MKTIRTFFSPILVGFVLLVAVSCDIDEANPSGSTADAVWTTPEGFVTLLTAAYSEQRAWYGKEDGLFMSEAGTDLWFNQNKANFANQLTRYEGFTPASGNPNKAAWRLLYKAINLCNAGINRIGTAGFTTDEERNKREGELRFLRAFYYWHVVETYGGVNLLTTETQGVSLTASRRPVEDFYTLIVQDLEFAAQHLPNDWGNEYSRATKKSALGLLARAYLSRAYYAGGDAYFTKARDVAREVIDRKSELGVELWADYADLWKPANNKKNKEALYAISNSSNPALNYDLNANRLHMWFLAPYSARPGLQLSLEYGNDNQRRLMPTLALLDFFDEQKDARYQGSFQEVWISNKDYTWTANDVKTFNKDPSLVGKKIRAGIDTAMYVTKKSLTNERLLPYFAKDRDSTYQAVSNKAISAGNEFVVLKKYRDPNRAAANAQPGFQDIIVMRLAEMYLIAAEAELQLGNTAEAVKQLNVLRTRAARKVPVDYTVAMQITENEVTLDFILDERARELAGEHLRWFDLKRTGKLVERVLKFNPDITAIQEFHRLRPVPQEEIDALLNGQEFGQNPGY